MIVSYQEQEIYTIFSIYCIYCLNFTIHHLHPTSWQCWRFFRLNYQVFLSWTVVLILLTSDNIAILTLVIKCMWWSHYFLRHCLYWCPCIGWVSEHIVLRLVNCLPVCMKGKPWLHPQVLSRYSPYVSYFFLRDDIRVVVLDILLTIGASRWGENVLYRHLVMQRTTQ